MTVVASDKPSILVVEDDELVRNFVVGQFRHAGYKVLEAETAEAALSLAARTNFEVLFTDIRLPGPMDGWALAVAVRQVNPAVRIIYSTGYASNRHQQLPGTKFMMKPYRARDVLSAVSQLLAAAE
jgi:CheY-like chemotaxis protein